VKQSPRLGVVVKARRWLFVPENRSFLQQRLSNTLVYTVLFAMTGLFQMARAGRI